VTILIYLFLARDALPPPFGECGYDETIDELRCVEFPGCS